MMVEKITRWLSASEIYKHIENFRRPDMLFHVYGLSLFTNYAFYTADFEPDERWKECVVLSEAGCDLCDNLHRNGLDFPEHHEIFALFRIFYHHDLLIDYERTNISIVLDLLQENQLSGKSKWPYVFGNELYHKFNYTCTTNRTDQLDGSAVEELLNGTPQGVFQVGNLVVGPLGFINSKECRAIIPTLVPFPVTEFRVLSEIS